MIQRASQQAAEAPDAKAPTDEPVARDDQESRKGAPAEATSVPRPNDAAEKKAADQYIKKFSVKTPSSERLITLLSGGNQQKVLVSRWLIRELKIIILDEPTRGVDIGAKTEVLSLINDLAKQGLSVLLMPSEMNDLLSLSDRILVMADGKISKEFYRGKVTQEEIFKASVN